MRIKTQLMNECCAKNRQKRKVNIDVSSLDLLEEEYSDGYFIQFIDRDMGENLFLKEKIIELFNDEDYIKAFMIDLIISFNVFMNGRRGLKFSFSKLENLINNLDNSYMLYFSSVYSISIEKVKSAYDSIKVNKKIHRNLVNSFNELKRNKDLYRFLRNDY